MAFLSHMSFRQMLVTFFMVITGLFVFNNAASLYISYLQEQAFAERRHDIVKLSEMRNIIAQFGFVSREMAHQVLATNSEQLQEQTADATDKYNRLEESIKSFKKQAFREEESVLIAELDKHIETLGSNFKKIIQLAAADPINDGPALEVIDISEEDEDVTLDIAGKYMVLLEKHMAGASRRVDILHYTSVTFMVGFAALNVILCIFMSATLQKHMGTIAGSVHQVRKGYQQVTTNVDSVTRTVEEEAAAVHEVVTAMDEFAKTVSHIAKQSDETAKNTESIRVMVDKAHSAMGQLATGAGKIHEVVRVIEGISEQTNLLALNAAIEAARAGDAGRGFAVVADEVRKLAQHTTSSTGEIQQSIQSLTADVNNLGTVLDEIRTAITHIDTQASEISSATHQQNASMTQINQAVDRMNRSMLDIGQAMDQTRNSTNVMGESCQHLTTQVSKG